MCWSTLLHPFKSVEVRCKDCLIAGWDRVTIQSFHLLDPEFSFLRVFSHSQFIRNCQNDSLTIYLCSWCGCKSMYKYFLLFPPSSVLVVSASWLFLLIKLHFSVSFTFLLLLPCLCGVSLWVPSSSERSVIFCLPPSPPKLCLLMIPSPFQFVNFFFCFFPPRCFISSFSLSNSDVVNFN